MDDRSRLGDLYPKAKTYDQRQADRQQVNRLKAVRAQKAKRQALLSCAITLGVVVVAYFVMNYIARHAGEVATVLLAFPIGLIPVSAILWSIYSLRGAFGGQSNT